MLQCRKRLDTSRQAAVSNPLWEYLFAYGRYYLCSRPPWTASSYWPCLLPLRLNVIRSNLSCSIQDGQLCTHPPCVATGAVPQGPSGQETTPAEYPAYMNLVPEAAGFNFLGGRGCAEIRDTRRYCYDRQPTSWPSVYQSYTWDSTTYCPRSSPFHHPSHLQHLPHNLLIHLNLGQLVHNTLLPLALAQTPNDLAFLARAALSQVAPLDACPTLLKTLDLLDLQSLLLSAPAVVRII